jgi:hypothetical protein
MYGSLGGFLYDGLTLDGQHIRQIDGEFSFANVINVDVQDSLRVGRYDPKDYVSQVRIVSHQFVQVDAEGASLVECRRRDFGQVRQVVEFIAGTVNVSVRAPQVGFVPDSDVVVRYVSPAGVNPVNSLHVDGDNRQGFVLRLIEQPHHVESRHETAARLNNRELSAKGFDPFAIIPNIRLEGVVVVQMAVNAVMLQLQF